MTRLIKNVLEKFQSVGFCIPLADCYSIVFALGNCIVKLVVIFPLRCFGKYFDLVPFILGGCCLNEKCLSNYHRFG